MAYHSTMLGESSYDIISHMTSMENRLMEKLRDIVDAQEFLHQVCFELRDAVKAATLRAHCPPSDAPVAFKRSFVSRSSEEFGASHATVPTERTRKSLSLPEIEIMSENQSNRPEATEVLKDTPNSWETEPVQKVFPSLNSPESAMATSATGISTDLEAMDASRDGTPWFKDSAAMFHKDLRAAR